MSCECSLLAPLADVGMGHHRAIFESIKEVKRFGDQAWWLWLGRCHVCETHWLIAQDDRVSDAFFMRRTTPLELSQIGQDVWPDQFRTYEEVLALGRERGHEWTFLNRVPDSLVWTVCDLVLEREDIDIPRIAYLLNVDEQHANEIIGEAEKVHGVKVRRQ